MMNIDNSQFGTLFLRRPRGKKLTFILGGPITLESAAKYVNWDGVRKSGDVVIFIDGNNIEHEVKEPNRG